MNLLFLFSASLTLILGLLSFAKKQGARSNVWLGMWLVITSIEIITFYVDHKGLYEAYPYLLGVKYLFPFIHPPLLYLYIRSLTGFRITGIKVLFHFAPLLAFGLNLISLFAANYEQKLEILERAKISLEGSVLEYLPLAVFIYGGTYLIIGYQILLKGIPTAARNILWVRRFTFRYLVFWCLIAVLSAVDTVLALHHAYWIETARLLGFVLFIVLIGLDGLSHTTLFSRMVEKVGDQIPIVKKLQRWYVRSGLDEERAREYYDLILDLLQKEKIFTNSRLRLSDLSASLHATENHLSQSINICFKGNFYELINSYRLKEFKSRVSEGHHKKIPLMTLAKECGFSSKTSFNKVFKASVGQTPSKYLADLQD